MSESEKRSTLLILNNALLVSHYNAFSIDAQTFIHPYSSILLFSRKLKQLITPYYSITLHITIQQMGACGTTLNLCKALKINRLFKAFFVEIKHMLKLSPKPLPSLTCR